MFETVITQVVNRFLGEYIEGMDREQLGIHLLRGELKLENLTIKGAALNEKLALPVELVFGHIGLLHITWNWLALRTSPVTVILSDVNLLLHEKNPVKAVQQGKEKLLEEAKEARKDGLSVEEKEEHDAVDKKKKAQSAAQSAKADRLAAVEELRLSTDQESKEPGFVEKMIQGILANLRVLIRNIHVRYEHTRDPTNACSVGFALDELRISSTNGQWEKVHFVTREQERAHKLVELKGFAVYCNTNGKMWPQTPENMRGIFHNGLAQPPLEAVAAIREQELTQERDGLPMPSVAVLTPSMPRSSYDFLLQLSGTVRATINKAGATRSPDEPLASVQAVFPLIDVSLRRRQFLALLGLQTDMMETMEKMRLIDDDAKKAAAAAAAQDDTKERVGTNEEKERYITLYKRTLSTSWEPELDDVEIREIQRLEREIEYKSLDEWRLCAIAELRAEMPPPGSSTNDPVALAAGVISSSTAATTSSTSETPASPFSSSPTAPVTKRVTKKDNLSFMDRARQTAMSAVSTATSVVAPLATAVLPGTITDKLGLTTETERAAAAEREAEQRELERCRDAVANSFDRPSPTESVATVSYSPQDSVATVSYSPIEVVVDPIGTPLAPPTGSPVVQASSITDLPVIGPVATAVAAAVSAPAPESPAAPAGPRVMLTDEQRLAIRAQAIKTEAQQNTTTQAQDALFLPTDDRSADALNITADITIDRLAARLLESDGSEMWVAHLDKLRAKAAQRLETAVLSLELGAISLRDVIAHQCGCYADVLSTNHGVKAARTNRDESAKVLEPTAKVTAQPIESFAPLLLLHVNKLGSLANHALEVDAELNHLQVYLLPSLLSLPKFFDMPADRKQQAEFAAKEAAREARSAEFEEERRAAEASADSLQMADALIMGTAADPSVRPKKELIKLPDMPIYLRFRMSHPLILLSVEPQAQKSRGLVIGMALDVSACVGGVTKGAVQAQVHLGGLSVLESAFMTIDEPVRQETPAPQAVTVASAVVAPEAGVAAVTTTTALVEPVAPPTERMLLFSQTLEPGTRPILSPFHIKINVQTQLSTLFTDGQAQNITVDLHASRMDINIGFRFFQMLQEAMKNFMPDQAAKKARDAAAASKELDPDEKVRTSIQEHIDADASDPKKSAIPQDPLGPILEAQPMLPLNFHEINATIKLVGLYVNVINDGWSTALPFARLHLEDLTLQAHRFGDSGGICGTFELRAEMYNHRLLAWEPLIEPWSATIGVNQCQLTHTPAAPLLLASKEQLEASEDNDTITVGHGHVPSVSQSTLRKPLAPITSLSFTSKAPLNLNISAALLEDLTDVALELERLPEDTWRQVPSAPLYRLENHTDLAMQVYRTDLSLIESAPTGDVQPTEMLDLLPFSNTQFDFADDVSIPTRALRIQLISADGTLPLLTVPIAREVSSKHLLRPTGLATGATSSTNNDASGGAMTVLVDVTWSAGVRVISVHSAWAVQNQTSVPLVVSGDRMIEKELMPGAKVWLPLLRAPLMHSIRVKPLPAAARVTHAQQMLVGGTDHVDTIEGDFDWSREIVLTSTMQPVKKADTAGAPVMLDYHSCPPVGFDAASTTTVSTAASPFHFTCFHAGVDRIDRSEMRDGIEVPKTREFHASIFELRTPILCQNTLAGDAQVRIMTAAGASSSGKSSSKDEEAARHAHVVQEFNLVRGQSLPIFAANLAADTFISLRLPDLAADWSQPVKLTHKSDASVSVVLARLHGENGGMLPICVELKQTHGQLRVVLYTQYWMWDLSSLGLQVTPDKHLVLPRRAAVVRDAAASAGSRVRKNSAAHLESVSLPDRHAATMFGYDDVKSSKGRLYVRAGRHPRANGFDLAGPCADTADPDIQWSEWSDKVTVDATGNQSTITIPMGPAKSAGSYEVVVDVQAGEGIYHRTKMVKFLPRFILLNLLNAPVHIKQYGLAEDAYLTLASTQQIIWHWPQHAEKNHHWLSIRRADDGTTQPSALSLTHRDGVAPPASGDWHWSGFFGLETPGNQTILVRHRNDSSRVWFLNVEVRQRNGINFIMLNEHDTSDLSKLRIMLPYCISNRSHTELIRVRQKIDVKKNGQESSHLPIPAGKEDGKDPNFGFAWMEILPQTEIPFCFEEPLLPRRLEVEVALVGSKDASRQWTSSRQLRDLDLDEFGDETHAFIDYEHPHRDETMVMRLTGKLSRSAAQHRLANPSRHRLYYFAEQNGPASFIVFDDEPSVKWKKEQLRKKRNQVIEQLRGGGASTSLAAPGDQQVVRMPDADGAGALGALDVDEDKAHVATMGDKQTGSTAVTQDTLGVLTDQQLAQPTGQDAVDAQLLKKGHGIIATSPGPADEKLALAEYAPDGRGPSGLSFNLNARVVRERVRALRVRVHEAKGLREKDKNIFARVLLGTASRETDARKTLHAPHQPHQRVIEWNQEIVFEGHDIGSAGDCQHLMVDLYERHTLLSDTLIGGVSINLCNVNEQAGAPRWYELRKVKGSQTEMRGAIALSIWFDMKDGVPGSRAQASAGDLLRASPQQLDPNATLQQVGLTVAPPGADPQVKGTAHPLPDQSSNATFEYANASVYASSLQAMPVVQTKPPEFESLLPPNGDAEELERIAIEMMEQDAIENCSWSEYTLRLLDTLNLDRVASALMVDLSAGRVVCYVTAPMFRRGYSILLHDRQRGSIHKEWTNQEIVFALPDQLAAERKNDAVVRLSFYYYPAEMQPVQTKASLRVTHSLSASAVRSSTTEELGEYAQRPLLLGTTLIPLLSIFTRKMDSIAQQKEEDPSTAGIEGENDVVDVASLDPAALERHRYRRRQMKIAEEHASREELRAKEWNAKWLALGTPGQATESAEICLSIRRQEVKMPRAQAVAHTDTLANYEPARLRFRLRLPHIGISLIDSQPEEVAYITLQNVALQLHDSATSTSVKLSLDTIQIDDLLRDAIFPVILNATSVPPQDWMPVFQLAISRQKLPGINIQCFPYISFLLQMMDVKVSELYIYKLLDFLNDLNKRKLDAELQVASRQRKPGLTTPSEETKKHEAIIYRKMSDEFTLPPSQMRSIYTKFLHLQPIAVNVTFAANPGVRSKFMGESFAGGGFVGNLLRSVLTIVEAGVGSLDSAPIRLNGKIIEHHLGSPDSFKDILVAHYIKEGVKQLYRVLGSLEVLGNPVATASEFSTGVRDAFYEPAKGMMISPEAFGQGLAEGSLSLVRHTISGLGGAVAGVFSSGGKAAAALSMDSDFITRSSIRNAAEPDHVGEGLKLGVVSFANGVKEGITGLVKQPMRGAEEEGVKGAIKGLGKGIIGAFAKPAAGALNMVSQTSKGIANTGAYMSDGPRRHLTHVRAKRFISPLDGRITVYDKHQAEEALEAESLTAGDVKKDALRHEAGSTRKHESSTRILHDQTLDAQPRTDREIQRRANEVNTTIPRAY